MKALIEKKGKFLLLKPLLEQIYSNFSQHYDSIDQICRHSLSIYLVIVNGLGIDNNTCNPRTSQLQKLKWDQSQNNNINKIKNTPDQKEGKGYKPIDPLSPKIISIAQKLLWRSQGKGKRDKPDSKELMKFFLGDLLNIENSILFGLNLLRRLLRDKDSQYVKDLNNVDMNDTCSNITQSTEACSKNNNPKNKTPNSTLEILQKNFFNKISQQKAFNEKKKKVFHKQINYLENKIRVNQFPIDYTTRTNKKVKLDKAQTSAKIEAFKKEIKNIKIDHLELLRGLLKDGPQPILKNVLKFVTDYLEKNNKKFINQVNDSYKKINKTRIKDISNFVKSLETVPGNDMRKICDLLYLMVKNNDILRPLSEFEVNDAIRKLKIMVEIIARSDNKGGQLKDEIEKEMQKMQKELNKEYNGINEMSSRSGSDLNQEISGQISNDGTVIDSYSSKAHNSESLEGNSGAGSSGVRVGGANRRNLDCFKDEKDHPKWDWKKSLRRSIQKKKGKKRNVKKSKYFKKKSYM